MVYGKATSMISVKIKICGITSVDDAKLAIDLGADLLGFNLFPQSPRCVTFDQAEDIICQLPTFMDTVAVFVNPNPTEMKRFVEKGFFNWIQLHGDETPEFCRSLSWMNARIIKAIRVQSAEDIQKADAFPVDAILFDAFDKHLYGGTGKTFDWSLIKHLYRRVFLAGGITPENIIQALDLGVYCVDVCSGIESQPGKKDPQKMKLLFENARKVTGLKVRT
jgi:phosphoribosylanthranilate isomerase